MKIKDFIYLINNVLLINIRIYMFYYDRIWIIGL